MECYSVKLSDKGTIAVDDTILVKGVVTTAGSHILEGFKPLFSAEAVSRLENKGYEVAGKTHVGEFGLDLVGEFSYYGEKEEELKGAAATLVAGGEVKAALGVCRGKKNYDKRDSMLEKAHKRDIERQMKERNRY